MIFRKPYAREELRKLGLNERQIKAVEYVEKRGSITNREYRELFKIAKWTATKDLKELVRKGVFQAVGKTRREMRYILVFGTKSAKKVPNERTSKEEGRSNRNSIDCDPKMAQNLAQKVRGVVGG